MGAPAAPGRVAVDDWERSVLGPDGRPVPTDSGVTGRTAAGQTGSTARGARGFPQAPAIRPDTGMTSSMSQMDRGLA